MQFGAHHVIIRAKTIWTKSDSKTCAVTSHRIPNGDWSKWTCGRVSLFGHHLTIQEFTWGVEALLYVMCYRENKSCVVYNCGKRLAGIIFTARNKNRNGNIFYRASWYIYFSNWQNLHLENTNTEFQVWIAFLWMRLNHMSDNGWLGHVESPYCHIWLVIYYSPEIWFNAWCCYTSSYGGLHTNVWLLRIKLTSLPPCSNETIFSGYNIISHSPAILLPLHNLQVEALSDCHQKHKPPAKQQLQQCGRQP